MAGLCVAVGLARATDAVTEIAKDRIVPGQENIGLLSRYWDPKEFNWTAAGKAFDQVLPQNVRIATSSAGIIPFFCNRPCVDLCGLTDRAIAHSPIDPEERGRMGHEHCIEDYNDSLNRGVDIYLNWVDPRPFPRSLVTNVPDGMEMVSVRLPDGRYTEFVILNKNKVDLDALRQDSRLVFRGSQPVADRHSLHVLQQSYERSTIIDTLDLEDSGSQNTHAFQVVEPGHNWHEKVLQHRAPFENVFLQDTGFHVYQIRWNVLNVSPGVPLTMIVRVDRIGRGLYQLDVNGRSVTEPLEFPSGEEAWDELPFEIPAQFLIQGTNDFHLKLAPQHERTSEMYYMWFVQEQKSDHIETPANAAAPG